MPRPRRGRTAARDTDNDRVETHKDAVTTTKRTRKTRSLGAHLTEAENEALRAAEASRDNALDRLANEDVTTTTVMSGALVDESDTGSSVEMGRRVMATPAHRRDTTGLDLADTSVFGDLDDSFGDGDIPGGTLSVDVSTFSIISSTRPRSRQSSFIGRNDPPIRPSSRSGNTPGVSSSFNIGMFRRRAREPSILGTSRKPRPEPPTAGAANDTRAESEEDDFAPEAESTPLNNKRRRTEAAPETDSDEDLYSAPRPYTGASKKRKSDEGHAESDRPEKAARQEPKTVADPLDVDSESELSSLSSSPQLPEPAYPERPVTPINLDDVDAPPASSDSEDQGTVWPDIHTLAKRRRRPSATTPVRPGNLSDISSPPSLTHSPNFPETRTARHRGRTATRRPPSPNVTTADLTSLLPKRRYKKTRNSGDLGSDEELDTTGLGDDDDELSYIDTAAARRRKGSRSRPPSRGASSARPGSRGGHGHSALKPKTTPASAQARSRMRTYSRRSSDKENESDEEEDEEDGGDVSAYPDETFDQTAGSAVEIFAQPELKEASKKFKEVDKWELDFEEVVESSSPDAR
ncbi:hypothetical protein B0I35DRAFT_419537 [Stachybotrys elegans]|uniref:Uncharacterized protein n=1 Tax=Stachybotrys elegans TaxID=80388 RepID=A0A8K0WXE8_9HYPO|nr:hypothetical protein B0I35DRAFT_419537 [Stachybotrys elegans]